MQRFKRYKETKIQKIQRFKSTKIQWYKRYKDTKYTKLQRYKITKIQRNKRYKDTKIQKIQRYKDTMIQGYIWIQGYMETKKGIKKVTRNFPGITYQVYKTSNTPSSSIYLTSYLY